MKRCIELKKLQQIKTNQIRDKDVVECTKTCIIQKVNVGEG